jgi:hypothetical protein
VSDEHLLRHVVLFEFTPGISDDQLNAVENAFRAMPAQIGEIHALEWGVAVNEPKPYSHCLLVTFRDEAGLRVYDEHPLHKAAGAEFGHLVSAAAVLDYWTGG